MPQDAEMVHINTDLIPPWVAEYLTECLYNSVRNFFSVPENQAKFEEWRRLRAAGTQVCPEGQTADGRIEDSSAAPRERDQRREAAQKGE